jgi:hypothetical protein
MLGVMVIAVREKPRPGNALEPERAWYGRLLRPEVWFAMFAVYAGADAAGSGLGLDRLWGVLAACGYGVAAVVSACWRTPRGMQASLAASLTGGLAAPLAWFGGWKPATPDVAVVTRSAALLLHHGSPYLPSAQLAHGGWLAYDPYLPFMTVFGLPRGLGLPGLAGDPRPWLAAATFGLLIAAFRVAAPGRAAGRRALFVIASPVMAFPLALGNTDPPVIALTCLAVALAARGCLPRTRDGVHQDSALWSVTSAAAVIGVACAMKETAWPAVAVLAAMVAARYGARAAVRFVCAVAATAVALIVVGAPAASFHPGDLIRNTVAYPLGLTSARSPAQSPLPGHLLATLGPAGHAAAVTLLVAAMIAVAASLLLRPPVTAGAAVGRLALALSLMFAFCPATRFGYFAYPAALCGWLALTRISGPGYWRSLPGTTRPDS